MIENSYWEHFFHNDQMAFVYLNFNCKDSADVVSPVYKKNLYFSISVRTVNHEIIAFLPWKISARFFRPELRLH